MTRTNIHNTSFTSTFLQKKKIRILSIDGGGSSEVSDYQLCKLCEAALVAGDRNY